MSAYRLQFVSQTNAIFFVLLSSILFIVGVSYFAETLQQIPLWLFTILSILVAIIFWQIFVTAKTEWTIDDTGFKMIWAKPFFFNHKPDLNFSWKEIESIQSSYSIYYKWLKIKPVSGKPFKFYHTTYLSTAEFDRLVKSMKHFVEENVRVKN